MGTDIRLKGNESLCVDFRASGVHCLTEDNGVVLTFGFVTEAGFSFEDRETALRAVLAGDLSWNDKTLRRGRGFYRF